MSYFLSKGDYVMMYVILCISIHMMLIVLFVCLSVTFSVNGNSISIEVLTGLNFKKWKEDFLFGMEQADESRLTVGNNEKADVVFVGDVILILDSGFRLMLKDTFYVPSFRRNLVFVSC